MNRLFVFAVVLCGFLLSSWSAGGSVGVSSACGGSQCMVGASSSPASLLLSLALTAFVLAYPQRTSMPDETRAVGIWRRFSAFFIDFMLVLSIVSSLGAVPLLIAEGHFSGVFQWAFQREFARPTDNIYILPSVFFAFVSLFLYFYLHLRAEKQTVGQYVLGYRVATAEQATKPQNGRRVLLSFIGLCTWPISVVLALRSPRKTFWWDVKTNTKAVRVSN